MCNYLNNIINTENGFLLNAAANSCLSPLYGILSFCGVQRHVFNYSTETGAFTEAPRELREQCSAIQILTTAAFVLLVIPATLVGLTLKALSLCDPELRALYQRVWTRTIEPPPPPIPRPSIPIQPPAQPASNGLFSIDNTLLFNCVFPYSTIKDLITIQSVSRQTYALMHTPTTFGKYPVLFSLQPRDKCSLDQHLRTLFSSRLSEKDVIPLNLHLFQTTRFPLFKIPLVDKVTFTHRITAQEKSDFADLTPALGPAVGTQYKCILREVHRWWNTNLERVSKYPSVFRLSLSASIDEVAYAEIAYEKEILFIKYTFFYVKENTGEHLVAHEYLAFHYNADHWHCFDSRGINFLSDNSLTAHELIIQFPSRFLDSSAEHIRIPPRSVHRPDYLDCYHLRILLEEKVLPLFRDVNATQPKFLSKQNRAYYNLPIIIGHRTLEEMQSLFTIRTHHERENYHLIDFVVPRNLASASLFRKEGYTT